MSKFLKSGTGIGTDYNRDSHFYMRRKGPYLFLSPQYDTAHPPADPNEFIVIRGPFELNALIRFLEKELERTYPSFKTLVEKRVQNE